jgi:hydroxymethylpyrimidine pyrophosphatase-like HAD family hydrolase
LSATALPTGVLPGGRFDAWTPRAVRYVVCDVDGTLVGPDPLATAEVVAAIARVQAAGIRVGYATGRMGGAIRSLHEQLGALGPHVVHNGAEVREGGHTVAAWTLTPAQVDALLDLAAEHDDVYLEVYTTEGYHVSAWDERARPHWELLGEEPRSVIARASELDDPTVMKATFTVFDPAAGTWLLDRLATLDVEVGPAGSPLTPGLSYVNAN